MAQSANKQLQPVVLGSDLNAYGIARSFYEAYGVQSILVCRTLLGPCKNTKFVKQVITHEDIEQDEVFVRTLQELEKKYSSSEYDLVPIPCGDSYSELVSRNKKDLEDKFIINIVDYTLHKKLNRKETFYKLCEKYDLAYPKTWVATKDNYKDPISNLTFPLIVKPTNSIMYWATSFVGKRKVFMARDVAEFNKILSAVYGSTYDDALIVQEYIPGEREAEFHFYSDQHGKVQFMQFDEMILGSPTPDGIGSHTAEAVKEAPELAQQFSNFLNDIEYKGFGNLDFKYDPRDNKWKTFEINLRPARCSYAMTAAGHNLAKLIVGDRVQNKPMEFTISKDPLLYTLVPDKLLKKYAPDEWLPEVNELLASEKVVRHYFPKEDRNILRGIDHARDQRKYYAKFSKYFGQSMITDI